MPSLLPLLVVVLPHRWYPKGWRTLRINPRLSRQVQYANCWGNHYRSHCWLHCALDFTFAE
jgi:hypothetical protein